VPIKPLPPTLASNSKRSIFSTYWKADQTTNEPSSPVSTRSNIDSGQQEVLWQQQQGGEVSKTYTYTYLHNPFKYFGIEESDSGTTDEDDSSTNSYERVLRRQEGTPTKTRERSRTCPSFCNAGAHTTEELRRSTKMTTQSDTLLFAKSSTMKRLSCLRKGRFSCENLRSYNEYDGNCNMRESGKQKGGLISSKSVPKISLLPSPRTLKRVESKTLVSFDESRTQIHWFHPPVEKWAPSGWSSWFGV